MCYENEEDRLHDELEEAEETIKEQEDEIYNLKQKIKMLEKQLAKPKKTKIKYAVVYNRGANTAEITTVNMNDIFTSNNNNGWTFQSLGGPHDYCGNELLFDDLETAKQEMNKLLELLT